MKTRIVTIVTGIFLFGMSNMFGQGTMHGHHMTAGHNTEMKSYDVPDAFQKQLTGVLTDYLVLKDALVAANETEAEKAAKKTIKALDAVDTKLLEGEAYKTWKKQQKAIESNLNGIIQMKGMSMKRSHFSVVSENLTEAVKTFGIDHGQPVYVDYCPMANNNQGAYWLSMEKEIKNPYSGDDAMMKCGTIKATVN
ncbi:MAG: DUF3347 domain-containing protein [Chlorobi bacterium]|nr:DUF3347 domain-containing protein [Chlorobiota bacterium]